MEALGDVMGTAHDSTHTTMPAAHPGEQVGKRIGLAISEPAEVTEEAKPLDLGAEEFPAADDLQVQGPVKGSDATVVLATYDLERWPYLAATVERLLSAQEWPQRIVICVDRNEELHERIKSAWPQVTAVLNTRGRGVSGNRNTGAEYAETPFIAFLDDDVKIHDSWLSQLLRPFDDPTVVGTGGGVIADWEAGRPSWFPEEFDWVVGASYRGMPTVQDRVRNVWGENMAVRAEVFNAVGGFRSDFGKVGKRNSPEDTDLCIRMGANSPDAKWMYTPTALVEHHVPAARSTFRYFLRRTYLEGRGKIEMARLLGKQEKLENERAYLLRTLPAGITRGLRRAVRHGDVSGLLKACSIVAGVLAALIGTALGWLVLSGESLAGKVKACLKI